ncbi:30S ribosomal protein S11 [Patescibacteria group bacterium]
MADAKKKTTKKKVKRRVCPECNVYIQASYNNTIITITEPSGDVIAWSTAGANGFKGARKSTPYAAQVAAESAVEKAKLYGAEKVRVFVKGVGSGREQAVRGLNSAGLQILSISDMTPVPHNGCRPKKQRRN